MYNDTIAAIATPIGEGAIGVVRVSGPDALAVAAKVFKGRLSHRYLSWGLVVEPEDGSALDEVMATCMLAPNSYTCEDTVEIYGHGGAVSLQGVLKALLRCGARAAGPGEFTLRAFLNGRIDLSQAEAVRDVIEAKTDAGLRVAMNGLQGGLSQRVREARTAILEVLAYLTARIDFPDDDVPVEEPLPPIRKAMTSLEELIGSADAGIVYRHGVRVAIVGRPNVGKSSLLNRLLEQDRAIVTPIAGTTRDTVEEVANIKGIPFVLVDTAGLTETSDPVEHLGIERSLKALAGADLAIVALDSSETLTGQDMELMDRVVGMRTITVANKSDLPWVADVSSMPAGTVRASMVTGYGLGTLKDRMVEVALNGRRVGSGEALVSNARHKVALESAAGHLRLAEKALVEGLADDFVTIDLTAALNCLGEITGETVTEDLLHTIFARFCIGK